MSTLETISFQLFVSEIHSLPFYRHEVDLQDELPMFPKYNNVS